jgi:large subunit ribosomal protein L31e
MAVKEAKLERTYIIPLRKVWLKAPKHKRAKKAIRAVREFLARHMRAEMKDIKIGKWLNTLLWERGIRKPVAKVKVKVIKEEGIVRAEVAELSEYAKKIEAKLKSKESKSKKEEKREEKAEEKKEEEKKIEETAKEELKEEDKEKKEEEKITQKEAKKADTSHVPKDEHMHVKTKIMRTD